MGKTYPSLIGAALDYALFGALVLTLPSLFGWGIQSIWWIKLVTAFADMVVVGTWLRWELQRVRSNMAIAMGVVEMQCS